MTAVTTRKFEAILAYDLDNTLIYSRRRLSEINNPVCVEHLNGQEQSYMSQRSVHLLQKIVERWELIPVTTRSLEQYRRLEFPPTIRPKTALAANGAILLIDDRVDETWRQQSERLADLCRAELQNAAEILAADPRVDLPPRMVDDMYLFLRALSDDAALDVADRLRRLTALPVGISGRKVYAFPRGLDKGAALLRLKQRFSVGKVFAAGDAPSTDLSLLKESDAAFVPTEDMAQNLPPGKARVCCRPYLFAEQFLEQVLSIVNTK